MPKRTINDFFKVVSKKKVFPELFDITSSISNWNKMIWVCTSVICDILIFKGAFGFLNFNVLYTHNSFKTKTS